MTKPPGRKAGAPGSSGPQRPNPRAGERWVPAAALGAVALYGLYWAFKAFTQHHLGNYAVETDFYWKYGPAAAGLKEGRVLIEHFDSKGWGYPLVVALVSFLGFDLFRAGQLVALASACVAAWCAFRLNRALLGATLGFLSLLLLLGNPTFLSNTYEVGTDMFFFAVTLASIALLLATKNRTRLVLLASGFLGGWAFATRYNGLFLWPAALLAIVALDPAGRPAVRAQGSGTPLAAAPSARWRAAAIWTGGFLIGAAPWLVVNWAHTGNPLTNNNYTNVGFAVYGEGNWEKFFYGGDRPVRSFA
ncbi:MAG: glycosyltransferase family 39 protein, partial [Candidatus Latescibacteria bacterium]|nr:glycosyltransferase family 39 protein [Candidatus Latescibacterota bacterium]